MSALLRRLRSDQCGLTLPELLVASLVATITLTIVVAWVAAATRSDLFQEADFQVLNDLRFAKAELVSELRYADGLIASAANTVEVWIDNDRSGGGAPDQPGEHVIWSIVGDDLVRYVDSDPTTAKVWVEGLHTPSSSLSVAGTVVTLELTSMVESAHGEEPRTIATQVTLRNG